jgi:hypothetical protein
MGAMASSEKEGPPVVPLADFDACVLEAPIAALDQVGMTLSLAYHQASAKTPSPCREVFRLLGEIAGIHLNPAERGRVWRPGTSFDNRRSMIPSDIRGEQSDVLEAVLPRVQQPALRARIADIVWTNDMRKGEVAKAAIDAYCDCVEGLINGTLKAAFPTGSRDLVDAQTPAHRALQIASATTKRGSPLPDRVISILTALYDAARNDGQPVIFSRIVQLCVDYKIIEAKQAAIDLEVAANAKPDIYPDAIRMALDFAGVLHKRAGDQESEKRCQLGAVRQLLRMRDECDQAGAKASWVMDALLRLRHIKSDEAFSLESDLEDELRRLQRASLREMGTFAVNIEVPAERDRIIEIFSEMDFSTALKSFALLDRSPKMDDLKAAALEQGKKSPLSTMMGVKHVDDEGKTVVNTAGAGSEEPPHDWYLHMIARLESLRRAMVVANYIEPVRLHINNMVAIEERHFNPIVWQSAFAPKLQAPLYALGFARFFQGDFPSASHLLIPQLEPSLRYILKAHGADPTKRRDDATEEDRSLDAIITNHRAELVDILGAPLLDELDRIFNIQPGPALRHDVAHGQLSAGQCYSPDVIYACWLLYRVCCLFLMEKWDEWVRPGLAIEEPGR